MLTSIELRWFYPGTLPPEIQDWFNSQAQGVPPEAPEQREDFYLLLPECETLGIKLRQERLEIKWRKAELGVLRFGDNVEGKAEKWVKWICEDNTVESLVKVDVESKAYWVGVLKERSLRKYPNCNVEITRLTIEGNAWWSFAFEAYGEEANLIDNLQSAANLVFQTYSGSYFQLQDSYAYPKWLTLAIIHPGTN
ncbi:MAG TPA: hypothetical protein DCY88_14715 [Cyanobacteria bacterium UBA11372]|nr:hypothetical protein [Cyanobacteria bacterium UBA11372]